MATLSEMSWGQRLGLALVQIHEATGPDGLEQATGLTGIPVRTPEAYIEALQVELRWTKTVVLIGLASVALDAAALSVGTWATVLVQEDPVGASFGLGMLAALMLGLGAWTLGFGIYTFKHLLGARGAFQKRALVLEGYLNLTRGAQAWFRASLSQKAGEA